MHSTFQKFGVSKYTVSKYKCILLFNKDALNWSKVKVKKTFQCFPQDFVTLVAAGDVRY